MKNNVRKAGISMVALVITIIVLIILTSAVIITGIGAPKQAQLATFYSNIDTVQDLVNIQMGNNMITAAQNGYGTNYKWVGIATKMQEGIKATYTANDGITNETVSFERVVDGLDKDVVQISQELIGNQTSLPIEERTKYYVDQQGKVYYEGVVIDGKTYYNKETISNTSTPQGEDGILGISAVDIAAKPNEYYGAYVNYIGADGNPYKNEKLKDITWRIFHVEGENIYITTSRQVAETSWEWNDGNDRQLALDYLKGDSEYFNNRYAISAKNGMTYETFRNSYNTIVGENAQNLEGDEENGYLCNWDDNTVKRLNGTLQADLYNYGGREYYWLASPSADDEGCLMCVWCDEYEDDGYMDYYDYDYASGVRPLVCLKSNIRLLKNGDTYELSDGVPIVTNETSTISDAIRIKAMDDNGIIGYAVTESNVQPTNFTSCMQTTLLIQEIGGLTPSTTYYVWVKDIDGNVSIGKEVKTVDGIPIVTNETRATLDLDTIIIRAVDDKGIIGYAITENNVQPTNFTSCIQTALLIQEIGGLTPSTTYYVWVKDNEGNVSEGKRVITSTAFAVAVNPELYYGAVVNYTDTNGLPFKALDGTKNLEWRIFYSDGMNIYITTTTTIGKAGLDAYYGVYNGEDAVRRLRTNSGAYVNSMYADSEKTSDGITYEMFRDSYNQVRGSSEEQNLEVDVNGNVIWNSSVSNPVSRLSGLQEDLYDFGSLYWLASPSFGSVMCVYLAHVTTSNYAYRYNGIRPLVCLKSNVQLIESGVLDANGYMTYNISTVTP